MKVPTKITHNILHFTISYNCTVPKPGSLSFQRAAFFSNRISTHPDSTQDQTFHYNTCFGSIQPAIDDYVDEAVEALKSSKVIAVPTDTLYGLACSACSREAIQSVYEIKGRAHTKPLAICVADVEDIKRFVVTNHLPHGLLHALLPGPVTLVLKRGDESEVERSMNPGNGSLGVRVPDSAFIRAIARGLGTAVALTSANLSGKPSSVSVGEFKELWGECAHVYDGGVLPCGRAGSTVIDLSTPGSFKILRAGSAREETVQTLRNFSVVEQSAI